MEVEARLAAEGDLAREGDVPWAEADVMLAARAVRMRRVFI